MDRATSLAGVATIASCPNIQFRLPTSPDPGVHEVTLNTSQNPSHFPGPTKREQWPYVVFLRKDSKAPRLKYKSGYYIVLRYILPACEVSDSPNPERKQLPTAFPTSMLTTYPSIESGLRQPPWAAKEEPRVNRAQYRPPEYEKDDMLRLI